MLFNRLSRFSHEVNACRNCGLLIDTVYLSCLLSLWKIVFVSGSFLFNRSVDWGLNVSAFAGFVQISSISFPNGISPCFRIDNGLLSSLLRTITSPILLTRLVKNSFIVALYSNRGFPTAVILSCVACGTLS